MLKELGLVFSCVSLLGSGQPQRNYSHTENNGYNTEITYKYDSNEVNSVDDLVRGNIYNFDFSVDNGNLDSLFSGADPIVLKFFVISGDFNINFSLNHIYDYDFATVVYDSVSLYFYGYTQRSYVDLSAGDMAFTFEFQEDYEISTYDCVVMLDDYSSNINYQCFSYTDYNEIESVEYVAPNTFIGVINEFCQNYIFSEIPLVNEITFTVGGQQISLMTYIVIFVGLVCGVGLLILFIMLLKWLFLLVAGGFRLRR